MVMLKIGNVPLEIVPYFTMNSLIISFKHHL